MRKLQKQKELILATICESRDMLGNTKDSLVSLVMELGRL